MTIHQRIHAFTLLGTYLRTHAELDLGIKQAHLKNPWFTSENVSLALQSWSSNLTEEALWAWIAPYKADFEMENTKTLGLILAGNIPLVGFHDILTCLMAGFSIEVKPSSDDAGLTTHILQKLISIEPAFQSRIKLVDRLQAYDAIIATGSNNSARYFEHYFRQVPHIIRKNRNGIAVLSGQESGEALSALGRDIFSYFGLGCRNVSKIYVPKGFDYSRFFEAIEAYASVGQHYKYHNNYDYYKSIYLVNGDAHLDNGFLLLKQDAQFASPLAVVYYEEYEDLDRLQHLLQERRDAIQCIVSTLPLQHSAKVVPFGESQHPGLNDFADNIHVFEWLKHIA